MRTNETTKIANRGRSEQLRVTVIKPPRKRKHIKTLVEKLWPLTWMGIEPPNLSLRNLVMEVELL